MLGSYEAFKDSIYDLATIDLSSYKERQMKRRIDSLINRHGIKSYKDYVERLRTDKLIYNEFINYITINVSEFYRNRINGRFWKKMRFPFFLVISVRN